MHLAQYIWPYVIWSLISFDTCREWGKHFSAGGDAMAAARFMTEGNF